MMCINSQACDRPLQGIAEIIIGKQRNGPVGVAELTYMSPYTSFEDLEPDMPGPSEINHVREMDFGDCIRA